MNNKEKIKLEIERLKDEKEDLKWESSSSLALIWGVLIFLATTTIALVNSNLSFDMKIVIVCFGILLIITILVINKIPKKMFSKLIKFKKILIRNMNN